jgi:hypothetical protein
MPDVGDAPMHCSGNVQSLAEAQTLQQTASGIPPAPAMHRFPGAQSVKTLQD